MQLEGIILGPNYASVPLDERPDGFPVGTGELCASLKGSEAELQPYLGTLLREEFIVPCRLCSALPHRGQGLQGGAPRRPWEATPAPTP
ncbi:hypothetical protein DC20_15990 [Rufibacter tibetensis]|uniref:Uncharacterized protein n=1 Tax=Rufibacter tibetensis TaxID=512763 RepID=A0A0P0CXQ2_9BACT|nr:hypothetical protein DC20_15990 [Rufibacter tibetensis]